MDVYVYAGTYIKGLFGITVFELKKKLYHMKLHSPVLSSDWMLFHIRFYRLMCILER